MSDINEKEWRSIVREYITDNIIKFDDDTFSDSDNIFSMGFVNSLFAMKLLDFIEKKFEIKVEDDDIEISNFSSIDNIVNLIHRKKG